MNHGERSGDQFALRGGNGLHRNRVANLDRGFARYVGHNAERETSDAPTGNTYRLDGPFKIHVRRPLERHQAGNLRNSPCRELLMCQFGITGKGCLDIFSESFHAI